MMKKTLVLGASTNVERYGNIASKRLQQYQHEVVPIGVREGMIGDLKILVGQPALEGIHTVTLYLHPLRQEAYYDYILSLKPKRIIFNPGTENPTLINLAKANGIEAVIACTLVMLSVGNY